MTFVTSLGLPIPRDYIAVITSSALSNIDTSFVIWMEKKSRRQNWLRNVLQQRKISQFFLLRQIKVVVLFNAAIVAYVLCLIIRHFQIPEQTKFLVND